MATDPNSPTVGRLLAFIADLSDLSGRVAGSEGERVCQERVAGLLADEGFDATVEGALCPPPVPLILGLHAASFLLGVALAPLSSWLSCSVTLVTLLSFWGELRGEPRILRRLLLKRLTGNMIARLPGPPPRAKQGPRAFAPKIVLVAHADVASSSALFHPLVTRFFYRREQLRRSIHPGVIVLIAGIVQLLAAGLMWPAVDSFSGWLALLWAAIVHGGTLALAVDWWRSPPVEGAIDNGSGLAVCWAVAQKIASRPLHNAEFWVLVTGAREPDSGGIAAFIRQFGRVLPKDDVFFVNLDDVGRGQLHYITVEGRWERCVYRPTLPALAEELSKAPPFESVAASKLQDASDAGPPTEAGYRALTLTSLEDGVRPELLHTAADRASAVEPAALAEALDFTHALVRLLDERLA